MISRGEEKGTQVVRLKSTNPKLTKEQAIKAIGDMKSKFVVVSVKAGKAGKKPGKKKSPKKDADESK